MLDCRGEGEEYGVDDRRADGLVEGGDTVA